MKLSPAATLDIYSGETYYSLSKRISNRIIRFQTRINYIVILTKEKISLQVEEWSQCPEKELNKIGRGDDFMMRVLAMLEKPKILLGTFTIMSLCLGLVG